MARVSSRKYHTSRKITEIEIVRKAAGVDNKPGPYQGKMRMELVLYHPEMPVAVTVIAEERTIMTGSYRGHFNEQHRLCVFDDAQLKKVVSTFVQDCKDVAAGKPVRNQVMQQSEYLKQIAKKETHVEETGTDETDEVLPVKRGSGGKGIQATGGHRR